MQGVREVQVLCNQSWVIDLCSLLLPYAEPPAHFYRVSVVLLCLRSVPSDGHTEVCFSAPPAGKTDLLSCGVHGGVLPLRSALPLLGFVQTSCFASLFRFCL